jgi:hypothetical protein
MKYEMANLNHPEEIIMATQRSIINSMREVIEDLKKHELGKQPGLTWEQIDYFLVSFGDRKPKIIVQTESM